MRQKLFTKEIDNKLFAQYKYGSDLSKQMVVAKIFNPYNRGQWYIINSDPNDPDYLWAIVDLFEIEAGSVSREDLQTIKVPPFGLNLERDLYFQPINAQELYDRLRQGERFEHGGSIDVIQNDKDESYLTSVNAKPSDAAIKLAEGGEISRSNREMLSSQVKAIKHHANELSNLVTDKTPVEAWVVSKAERSETDLSDVTHYLDGLKYAEGGELSKSWGVMFFKEGKNRFGEKIESAFNNTTMKGTLKDAIKNVQEELVGNITYATIKDRAGDVLVAKVKQDGTINIYREGYGFDKMARGGTTKSYTYIPKSDIKRILVDDGDDAERKIIGNDILDGAYVKKEGSIMSFETFSKKLPVLHNIFAGDKDVEYIAKYDKYLDRMSYFKNGRRNSDRVLLPAAYKHYKHYAETGKYAKGGVTKNYEYIPKSKILRIDATVDGKQQKIFRKDILDGAHVKKSVPKVDKIELTTKFKLENININAWGTGKGLENNFYTTDVDGFAIKKPINNSSLVNIDGINFNVAKIDGDWKVIEPKSGLEISTGKLSNSKVSAIEDATYRLNQNGGGKNISQIIEKVIERFKERNYEAVQDNKSVPKSNKRELSERAQGILDSSLESFENKSANSKLASIKMVEDNLAANKKGIDNIGMGLDEDMVAAGEEFIKKVKSKEYIKAYKNKTFDYSQGQLNLKAKKLAEDKGISYENLSNPEYRIQLCQAFVAALTDANFHSEAKKFVADLEKEKWSDKLYKSKYYDASDTVREFGVSVSQMSSYEGDRIAEVFIFLFRMNGNQNLADSIEELFSKYAKGGVTFKDKVKSISNSLKGKKVPSKLKKDYGATYDKKESILAATRIAGAMKAKMESKKKR